MTVKGKIEEMISSANNNKLKGCVKVILGGLAMGAGFMMFCDGMQKAERNATLIDVVKGMSDAFDSETLDKTWKD